MKKTIQISCNEWFEKKCEFAAAAGFKHISVALTEIPEKTESEWELLTDEIGNILAKNGLSCVQSHLYWYPLKISSEIKEEKNEFSIKQAIIASGKLGAQWCAMHPRTSITSGFSVEQSMQDNISSISEYLEYAIKYNTGIAVENLPIFPHIWPAYPFFGWDYHDLCELVDYFQDEHVGVCWDTGHAHLMAYDQAEAIHFLGERIKCTHIHNNKRETDSHFPPDNGNIDWQQVMDALVSVGYDGALTLETHCEYQTSDLLLNFAKHNFGCLEYLESLVK